MFVLWGNEKLPKFTANSSATNPYVAIDNREKLCLPITLSRARHVEGLFDRAIPRGVRQYGILGAGLDTFAYRRTDLRAHFRVFETHHPSTQMARRHPLFAARHHPPHPARARAARPPRSLLFFDYLDADAFVPARTAVRVARMQR